MNKEITPIDTDITVDTAIHCELLMESIINFYLLFDGRNIIGITQIINLYVNIQIYIYYIYIYILIKVENNKRNISGRVALEACLNS